MKDPNKKKNISFIDRCFIYVIAFLIVRVIKFFSYMFTDEQLDELEDL